MKNLIWVLVLTLSVACGTESAQDSTRRQIRGAVAAPAPTCPGDFNGDNVVDGADFMVWQREVGKTGTSPADANQDGVVDNADLQIYKDNSGKTCPPPLSLAKSIDKLVAKYPYPTADNFAAFSSYNGTAGSASLRATWNPNSWAASVNLSPISWHDSSGNPGALAHGIAITPRHVISHNQHAGEIPGSTMTFVRMNGDVISIPTSTDYEVDASKFWRIMWLEDDLPADMVAAMPTADSYLLNKPIANLDKFREVHLQYVYAQGQRIGVNVMKDPGTIRSRYFKAPVSGDSGKPLFAIMDNEIVALSFWWTGMGGSSMIYDQKSIFEAIDRLSVRQGDSRMLRPRLKKVN